MNLSELNNSQSGFILRVHGSEAFHRRITEMGFVRGKNVKVIKNAPLQDPIEYEVMGYNVSLRRSEARLVEIVSSDEYNNFSLTEYNGMVGNNSQKLTVKHSDTNTIQIALVGNPNCGKTTLFNYASKSHERVGNYSGVTVDAKEATINSGKFKIKVTDLPGTYSLTDYSPEELFVRSHMFEKQPDIVVNVVAASNLERNLFLTTQLIDMNIKVIIALNMYDELGEKGIELDYVKLGKMMGIPIIPTVAVQGKGIKELTDEIINVYQDYNPIVRHIHINYGSMIEESITNIQKILRKDSNHQAYNSTRYTAIKLLEKDNDVIAKLKGSSIFESVMKTTEKEIKNLEDEYGESSDTIFINAKYGFISGASQRSNDPKR